MWPSHQEFPSVNMDGAAVYGELQHSPGLTAAILRRNHALKVATMLKNQMTKGTRFEDAKEIQENSTRQFFAIPQKGFL